MTLDAEPSSAVFDGLTSQFIDAEEEAFLSKAFSAMDFDSTGGVTFEELLKSFRFMGFTTEETQLRAIFKKADADKSGMITFDELKSFFADAKLRVTCSETEAAHILKKEPYSRSTDDVMRLRNFLSHAYPSFFHQYSRPVIIQLCRTSTILELNEGDVIWERGEASDKAYLILSGSVALWEKPEVVEPHAAAPVFGSSGTRSAGASRKWSGAKAGGSPMHKDEVAELKDLSTTTSAAFTRRLTAMKSMVSRAGVSFDDDDADDALFTPSPWNDLAKHVRSGGGLFGPTLEESYVTLSGSAFQQSSRPSASSSSSQLHLMPFHDAASPSLLSRNQSIQEEEGRHGRDLSRVSSVSSTAPWAPNREEGAGLPRSPSGGVDRRAVTRKKSCRFAGLTVETTSPHDTSPGSGGPRPSLSPSPASLPSLLSMRSPNRKVSRFSAFPQDLPSFGRQTFDSAGSPTSAGKQVSFKQAAEVSNHMNEAEGGVQDVGDTYPLWIQTSASLMSQSPQGQIRSGFSMERRSSFVSRQGLPVPQRGPLPSGGVGDADEAATDGSTELRFDLPVSSTHYDPPVISSTSHPSAAVRFDPPISRSITASHVMMGSKSLCPLVIPQVVSPTPFDSFSSYPEGMDDDTPPAGDKPTRLRKSATEKHVSMSPASPTTPIAKLTRAKSIAESPAVLLLSDDKSRSRNVFCGEASRLYHDARGAKVLWQSLAESGKAPRGHALVGFSGRGEILAGCALELFSCANTGATTAGTSRHKGARGPATKHRTTAMADGPLKLLVVERSTFIGMVDNVEGSLFRSSHILNLASKAHEQRTCPEMDQLTHYLSTLESFKSMTKGMIQEMSKHMTPCMLDVGGMMLTQGEPPPAMFVLVSGCVGCFVADPNALAQPDGSPVSVFSSSQHGPRDTDAHGHSGSLPIGMIAKLKMQMGRRGSPPLRGNRVRVTSSTEQGGSLSTRASLGGTGSAPAQHRLSTGSQGSAPTSELGLQQRASRNNSGLPQSLSKRDSTSSSTSGGKKPTRGPRGASAPSDGTGSFISKQNKVSLGGVATLQGVAAKWRSHHAKAQVVRRSKYGSEMNIERDTITEEHVGLAARLANLMQGKDTESYLTDAGTGGQVVTLQQTLLQEKFGELTHSITPGRIVGELELVNSLMSNASNPQRSETGGASSEGVFGTRSYVCPSSVVALEETCALMVDMYTYQRVIRRHREEVVAEQLGFLRRVPLFRGLREVSITPIISCLHWVTVQRGSVLQYEGMPLHGVYFIQSGQVDILRCPPDAEQPIITQSANFTADGVPRSDSRLLPALQLALRHVAVLGPNDFFGEDALLLDVGAEDDSHEVLVKAYNSGLGMGGLHTVTAVAAAECRLAWLRPSDMQLVDKAALVALLRYGRERELWRVDRAAVKPGMLPDTGMPPMVVKKAMGRPVAGTNPRFIYVGNKSTVQELEEGTIDDKADAEEEWRKQEVAKRKKCSLLDARKSRGMDMKVYDQWIAPAVRKAEFIKMYAAKSDTTGAAREVVAQEADRPPAGRPSKACLVALDGLTATDGMMSPSGEVPRLRLSLASLSGPASYPPSSEQGLFHPPSMRISKRSTGAPSPVLDVGTACDSSSMHNSSSSSSQVQPVDTRRSSHVSGIRRAPLHLELLHGKDQLRRLHALVAAAASASALPSPASSHPEVGPSPVHPEPEGGSDAVPTSLVARVSADATSASLVAAEPAVSGSIAETTVSNINPEPTAWLLEDGPLAAGAAVQQDSIAGESAGGQSAVGLPASSERWGSSDGQRVWEAAMLDSLIGSIADPGEPPPKPCTPSMSGHQAQGEHQDESEVQEAPSEGRAPVQNDGPATLEIASAADQRQNIAAAQPVMPRPALVSTFLYTKGDVRTKLESQRAAEAGVAQHAAPHSGGGGGGGGGSNSGGGGGGDGSGGGGGGSSGGGGSERMAVEHSVGDGEQKGHNLQSGTDHNADGCVGIKSSSAELSTVERMPPYSFREMGNYMPPLPSSPSSPQTSRRQPRMPPNSPPLWSASCLDLAGGFALQIKSAIVTSKNKPMSRRQGR